MVTVYLQRRYAITDKNREVTQVSASSLIDAKRYARVHFPKYRKVKYVGIGKRLPKHT